ncbi:hypothetical protein CARG_00585 [Corynebacterium argentoratense DSM 44202]|uniref:Calcineurin-like phosphoesterase domain-containing protein n=1 Tax=Corynebacterium argentoratense DSM 44202 TaxID=1348662 RepID=U3GXZ9_9CORY|nr:hypothetical protein CARG_00585 [Corynebacterium argentoratense DSM 44202]
MDTGKSGLNRALSVLGVSAGLGVGAGAAVIGHGLAELRRFTLHTVELPVLQPGTLARAGREDEGFFTVLHLSDLHMIPGQRAKQQWVQSLAECEPDLVVNTGDNLSDAHAVPEVLRALDPLLNTPGLFVFGTNDYFGPSPVNPANYLLGKKRKARGVELPWKGMRAAFVERGWRDCTHQRHEFSANGLRVAAAGVDDPHHNYDDYGSIAGAPNAQADISIGLTHSPEPRVLERFEADGYQLTLSGHTHGGQLCLPRVRVPWPGNSRFSSDSRVSDVLAHASVPEEIPNRWGSGVAGSLSAAQPTGHALVTNCGIDAARVSGMHRFGALWMHVSNGLGTSKFVPQRIMSKPSATRILLTETPRVSGA